MKRKEFLSILFAAFALVAVVTATAQPQGGGGRPQGTPEEMAEQMVDRMSEELSLTKDQKSEIYDIQVKLFEERKTGDGNRPSREEMEAMHEKMDAQIKEVLSDDQKKKYETMQSERGARGPRPQ